MVAENVSDRENDHVFLASSVRAAFERIRALVASYVPPETGLVDDLIEERKREAARE